MSAVPETSRAPYRFAHLSDLHLSDLSSVRLRQLFSKRILGYLSWRRRRRHEHRPQVLASLRNDLLQQSPCHVVITGDLTHIALPEEFRQAQQWLHGVGDASWVTVVPGNHDRYVATAWPQTLGLWREYMTSDPDSIQAQPETESVSPLLRVRGPIAFIGLDTAIPTAPFMATGRIGAEQLDRLDKVLQSLQGRDLLKVLLLHHPPVPGEEKWRKRLVDAPELAATLARHPVDVILHGHCHRGMQTRLQIDHVDIPVFGIASASAAGVHSDYPSTYNIYEVFAQSRGWSVNVVARTLDTTSGLFTPRELARIQVHRA